MEIFFSNLGRIAFFNIQKLNNYFDTKHFQNLEKKTFFDFFVNELVLKRKIMINFSFFASVISFITMDFFAFYRVREDFGTNLLITLGLGAIKHLVIETWFCVNSGVNVVDSSNVQTGPVLRNTLSVRVVRVGFSCL